ncbi:sugar phosphate isomerase/epimerase family protein [Thermohalobacter berrensis]|uniref:Xylose isomerase-like TIM barrel domain-containing protein n=1 Tax=Thermohalobacter berrensis TaxID=99594 RepID=A0A419TAX6_9FIRM|nr:sugar phosphate isomerase/epimerase [Thermohalobacter berrensis]RKD34638.1 hypothetical protein BET03_02085 [Thermohalobacter berrensis]
MNRKADKYKLGIFSWFGYILPLPKRLRLIKEAGFDVTTLWWEDEIGYKKEDMPKIVKECGLLIENIHVPYNYCEDLWSRENLIRQKAIKTHIEWIEECAKYNIPIIVMHVSDKNALKTPNKYGLFSLYELTKKAEELNVTLAIENTKYYSFIDYLLEYIKSDYLGFCYDSSHDWLYGKEKCGILNRWKYRLICTHLSDNNGVYDCHWLPGEGIINWQKVMRNVLIPSYRGNLTLEVIAQREKYCKPEKFLKEAYNRLQKLIESI